MASNRNNSAYDLNMFDPAKKRRSAQKQTELTLVSSDRTVRKTQAELKAEFRAILFKVIEFVIVAVLCASMIAPTILCRIRVNELNDQIAAVTKQLNERKSENTRLEMELKSIISLDNVQEYVENEIGMVKRDRYQIYYFDIENSNEILPAQ